MNNGFADYDYYVSVFGNLLNAANTDINPAVQVIKAIANQAALPDIFMESSSEETEPAGLALDKSLIRSALLSRNKDQLINYVGSLLNEAILDEVHSATLIRQIHDDLMTRQSTL